MERIVAFYLGLGRRSLRHSPNCGVCRRFACVQLSGNLALTYRRILTQRGDMHVTLGRIFLIGYAFLTGGLNLWLDSSKPPMTRLHRIVVAHVAAWRLAAGGGPFSPSPPGTEGRLAPL